MFEVDNSTFKTTSSMNANLIDFLVIIIHNRLVHQNFNFHDQCRSLIDIVHTENRLFTLD